MTLIGNKIRQYSIVAALGRGGMGDVYAAYDENLKRKVAVKAIQAGRGLSPLAKARFLREAQTLSQLDHPGICRIYDYIECDGAEYLILELIEGRTLTDARDDLGFGTQLAIARQIAQILDMAHGEGIIHRDLKPDNVMLTPDGQIKLLDFGLARAVDDHSLDEAMDPDLIPELPDDGRTMALPLATTLPGTILGSPLFMSPEQANSETVATASDLYSFGLLLQWMFTGDDAYADTDDLHTQLKMVRAARTEPPRGIDRDLTVLIERLKSKSPARRPTALASDERLAWIAGKPARKNRRWVLAAVLIGMILAGLKYTTDLHTEQRKAEANRAQAEDLMGFMLGDLRDKLEPVGRLDVLDDVGTKALEYYAARGQVDLGDEESFKLAKAMMQIGDVRMSQGNMEAAAQAFGQALITSRELVARDPTNPDWQAGLGAVHFWIGSILFSQGELDQAEHEFTEYLEISRGLTLLDPANPDWRMEVAYGFTNLAALAEDRGRYEVALPLIRDSIAIKRKLSSDRPGDASLIYSLVNSLAWAARMEDATGAPLRSLATLEEAVGLTKDLIAKDPHNTNYLSLLSVILQLIATQQADMGRNEEALVSFREDLAIISRLVEHDPTNTDWRSELAVSKRSLGLFLLRSGHIDEAVPLFTQGYDLVQELTAMDPDNTENLFQLAYARLSMAQGALARRQPAQAQEWLDRSVAEIRPDFGGRDDPMTRHYLAETLLWRGIAEERMGRNKDAKADWEEARNLLQPLIAETRDNSRLMVWAHLLARLGDMEGFRDIASRLKKMDFARCDFVGLCREYQLAAE